MIRRFFMTFSLLLLALLVPLGEAGLRADSWPAGVPRVPDPVCAYCGRKVCQPGCPQYRGSSTSSSRSSSHSRSSSYYKPKVKPMSTNQQIMLQSCSTLLSALFQSAFSDNGQQARMAAEKARLAAEQQKRLQELAERQAREAEIARKKGVAEWQACNARHEQERRIFLEEEADRLQAIARGWKSLAGESTSGSAPGGWIPQFHRVGEGGSLTPMPRAGSLPPAGGGWKAPMSAMDDLRAAAAAPGGMSLDEEKARAGQVFDGGSRDDVAGDPSVVDLRHLRDGEGRIDPRDMGSRSDSHRAPGGPIEPVKPKTPEEQRRERLAGLSDEQLEAEMARTQKVLKQIGQQGAQDAQNLETWSRESQEAQLAALDSCVEVLKGIATDKATGAASAAGKAGKTAVQIMATLKLQRELAKASREIEAARRKPGDPASREKVLTAIRDSIQKSAEYASSDEIKELWKVTSKELKVLPVAGQAEFFAKYGEEAMKWWQARSQIEATLRLQDGPRGQLETQRKIEQLYRDEMAERQRRRAQGQP